MNLNNPFSTLAGEEMVYAKIKEVERKTISTGHSNKEVANTAGLAYRSINNLSIKEKIKRIIGK